MAGTYEKDPNDIGALWLKVGRKGEYMTGEINGVKVICFPLQAKTEKSPAWRVLKSTPPIGQARNRPDDW